MAEPIADLLQLIGASGVPRGARVLRVGAASAAAERKLRTVIATFEGTQFAVNGDAFNASFPRNMDVAIVALPVAATADVFEELLYSAVAPSLAPEGLAIVQFCRDASDASLDAAKVAPAARETLQNFLTDNFGATTLLALASIMERFANDGAFKCIGWAPRTKHEVTAESIVWLVLRKRSPEETPRRAIVRSSRADRYSIAELGEFVRALRGEGVDFAEPKEFAERLRMHSNAPCGLIKLDIHRNIRRPPEVSRALRDAGAQALFLMMHRHPFNDAFFESDETWDVLKSIRDDGHQIGLHLDPIALIRTHGDVYAGVEAAISDFSKRNFHLRAATLHGDTSAHVAARALKAWDFFVEDRSRASWDGNPPEGEAFLADHIGRYSYTELAARFGIDDMVEAHFHHRGELLSPQPLVYLTDNSRSLQVTNIPGPDGTTRFGVSEPFRIPAQFAREAAPTLRAHPFLALFHPQWFW